MQLNQWPEAERPREKLIRLGANTLSDAELLAIFLRTGIAGCNAVELGRHLIDQFGSLNQLMNASQEEFCRVKGLGIAKFVQLQAVMEMARRALAEPLKRGATLDNAKSARKFAASQLAHQLNEVFALILLDSQHRLIDFKVLFKGTIHQTTVYPRVLVQAALEANAAAVLLCHNHPSGVAEPSQADIRITARVKDALALIDVEVLDHLVVTQGDVVSLAERGLC